VAQQLAELQPLQQLTCLILHASLVVEDEDADEDGFPSVPAAAYSALTASSRLQHLRISNCTLPAAVWQHIFPPGRQLPHLRELDMSADEHYSTPKAAPDDARLVSCCPGLQSINWQGRWCTVKVLGALGGGLSSLHKLYLGPELGSRATRIQSRARLGRLCQLTGLQLLELNGDAEELLLPLTQLTQLTDLQVSLGSEPLRRRDWHFQEEVGGPFSVLSECGWVGMPHSILGSQWAQNYGCCLCM
jgi:hypothetical protein